MRRIPYRALLPLAFGLLSAALIAWNWRAQPGCWSYDAGRPFWKCEAPESLLVWINVPAIAGFRLLLGWLRVGSLVGDLAKVPFILAWWWFVGTRLDFGLLGTGLYQRRRVWIWSLVGWSCLFAGMGLWTIWEEVRFRREYPWNGAALTPDASTVVLLLWLTAFFVLCLRAAAKLRRGETGRTQDRLASRRTLLAGAGGVLILAGCVTLVEQRDRARERQQTAAYDAASILVQGQVLDDAGKPVSGLQIELVPLFKEGDARYLGSVEAWTDAHGDYLLRPDEAGVYVLGVMVDQAPYATQPFLSRYYPDAAVEEGAARLQLAGSQHLRLGALHLHRLPLVRVPVTVVWQDGSPEKNASILFQNPLFPHEAGIGSESVFPDREGFVSLPAGFDYFAIAAAQCDAGKTIESRETNRVALSTKDGADLSRQVRLVLAGPPCRLWHPR